MHVLRETRRQKHVRSGWRRLAPTRTHGPHQRLPRLSRLCSTRDQPSSLLGLASRLPVHSVHPSDHCFPLTRVAHQFSALRPSRKPLLVGKDPHLAVFSLHRFPPIRHCHTPLLLPKSLSPSKRRRLLHLENFLFFRAPSRPTNSAVPPPVSESSPSFRGAWPRLVPPLSTLRLAQKFEAERPQSA